MSAKLNSAYRTKVGTITDEQRVASNIDEGALVTTASGI